MNRAIGSIGHVHSFDCEDFNQARFARCAVDSPQRLLLRALLEGLGDAVRRNDGSAGGRCYKRFGLLARHFDTNHPLSNTLEQLLSASGRWLATRVAERYEAENQVIDHIGLVLTFL